MKVENFKRFSLKMLCCEARAFTVLYSTESAHAYMILDHVASGCFVLGRAVHCEFDYWPLAVSGELRLGSVFPARALRLRTNAACGFAVSVIIT